ncbi:MAG: hypothetical protein HRU09_05320 [Oligoflexales bacterium]|nr:hypothetical protein [Oligoflexales bacterium]
MFSSFIALSQQAFLNLRRDHLLTAGVMISITLTFMAHIIDSWTLQESYQLLYDILSFSLNFFGSMIAIFWGTSCIGIERKSHYTVSLSGPVSRSLWLLSQYTGLFMALFGLIILNALIWQLSLLVLGYPAMSLEQITIFPLHFLSWAIISAAAVFFASFCSRSASLFCSWSVWIVGLVAPLVPIPKNDPLLEFILKFIRLFWNLQYFNISSNSGISIDSFLLTVSYAAALIACFLFAASHIFSQKDL